MKNGDCEFKGDRLKGRDLHIGSDLPDLAGRDLDGEGGNQRRTCLHRCGG